MTEQEAITLFNEIESKGVVNYHNSSFHVADMKDIKKTIFSFVDKEPAQECERCKLKDGENDILSHQCKRLQFENMVQQSRIKELEGLLREAQKQKQDRSEIDTITVGGRTYESNSC